ncbi:MAG: hypothetical protein KDA95_01795 [Acidimicrobiales bacterium]|nr:hypothetical protein [Acidimicrobiales bacterium]
MRLLAVLSVPETQKVPHVVLVGLMGSGKTTVGRKVAALLGSRFVDGDEELEQRFGRTVASWFEELGELEFREAEADVLDDLLESGSPVVIGAGGGVVVTGRNRLRLQRDDVAVAYLHGDPNFLGSRAKPKPHRPLLSGDVDPKEILAQMYEARDPWYREVADVIVEVRPAHESGESPKWRLARQVVEALVNAELVAPEVVNHSVAPR